MFFIKIKIKGYLKNNNEKTTEQIDTYAIKKNNIITYINNDIKHKISIDNKKITLIRENNEFSHKIVFELNKEYSSEYYLKEMHASFDILISTDKLIIENNKIFITYQIIDSNITYEYVLEMSDE